MNQLLKPSISKNDKRAKVIIYTLSIIVFLAIVVLDRLKVKPEWTAEWSVHYFALANAIINGTVFVILIIALLAVKAKNYIAHKNSMLLAVVLSSFFLVSYILHHLYAGSTSYGGEGMMKTIYYILLFTHIPLAGIVLPFILFTVYRGLTGEFDKHKKLVRYTFPIWLYVTISGVLVYWMISPYYNW